MHTNIEIKAHTISHDKIRQIIKQLNGVYKGLDHQTDTYFECANGRLKLREGNIENNLIWYERENKPDNKESKIVLYKNEHDSSLKLLLKYALNVSVVVEKDREIYFIDNVKIHLDKVNVLGTFVEIEAIDYDGTIGKQKLTEQCEYYKKLFGIEEKDLISNSYSDMILHRLTDLQNTAHKIVINNGK